MFLEQDTMYGINGFVKGKRILFFFVHFDRGIDNTLWGY